MLTVSPFLPPVGSSVRIFLGCFVPKFGRLLFLGMLAYVKAFGENHKLLPKALCVIAGVVLFGDRLAVLVGEPPSSISPSSSHVRLRTQVGFAFAYLLYASIMFCTIFGSRNRDDFVVLRICGGNSWVDRRGVPHDGSVRRRCGPAAAG